MKNFFLTKLTNYIIPSISYTYAIDHISFSTMYHLSAINIFNTNIQHLSRDKRLTLISGDGHREKHGLDHFLDHFLDYFWTIFWTIFFGPFYRGEAYH